VFTCKDLGNNLVNKILETDWPEMVFFKKIKN
jgi:hypothetical protein